MKLRFCRGKEVPVLKIGQFTDSFFPIVDGVGRVVYNYATTLCEKNQECYVISPMADIGYLGGFPFELLEFVSVSVPTQEQYHSGIPLLDVHYNRRMQKIQLDIIHAHSPFVAGQEAIRLANDRKIPLVGTFHSKYYDDFYKLTKTKMLADIGVKMVVNFYEHCDEVWAVSSNSADVLRDYGYKGDIVVMPNGTPDVKPSEEHMRAAKEKFGLDDRPILMYCGQMNWKKNIRRTLEAAAQLVKEGYDFQLVMVGQGPDRDEIAETCQEFGIMDRTVFTGHLQQDTLINGLYQAASLFVFPSLYDTSGMVIREAAAMETASIVVKGSAPAESIIEGKNGLLCEDTTESLASGIRTVLDNPYYGLLLGKAASKTIFLPWPTVLDKVLERYQHLIETNPRRA